MNEHTNSAIEETGRWRIVVREARTQARPIEMTSVMINGRIASFLTALARMALSCTALALPAAAAAAEHAHYRIDARFDAAGQLTAKVEIDLPPAEAAVEKVFLLNERLRVTEVTAAGGAQFSVEPTSLPIRGLQTVTIRASKPLRHLTLRYAGPVNAAGEVPAFSSDRVELNLEEFWVPIRRELGMEFTVDAHIRGLPRGVDMISQGEFRQRGTELFIRRTMPDQDLTIAGTPGLKKRTAPDVEFYAADLDDPLTALLYKHAVSSAAFHRGIYGAPENPIRMVVVPRASSGGYARRNFVAMPSFRKPGDPPPPFDQSSPARFVAHEFNHAWTKIPAAGGENYWVSESVAEYMALRYVEATFGADELRAMLDRKRKVPDGGPMLTERRPSNAALYQKGPVVLFDLEQRIGRDKLDSIVAHHDRPRSTKEFLAALATQTDEAVVKEFERRLNQGGTVYSVVMQGTTKGELTVADDGNGQRRAVLRFDDRGRGPDLLIRTRSDERGWLQSYNIEGLSYSKRPVAERFEVAGGRATWTSPADSGEAEANGYYIANQSTVEDAAALARALLAAENGTLPLLPTGKARIEKVLQHEFTIESGSAKPTLYLIHGTDLQPSPIWLDDDRQLFASGGNWMTYIKKGYESKVAELVSVQDKALVTAHAARTQSLQRRPKGPVLIRNARVFDAERRVARPGMSVLIRGDRIEAVGADSAVKAPPAAEIIDAQGKTLLPGFWDMHAHMLGHDEGTLDLLAGVTSIRDLGNDADTLDRLTRQFDDATLPGPWVVRAAMIDARGPFEGPTKNLVSTPEEMRKTVNALADRGYPQVKFYNALSRELLEAGIAAARARGMRVSGHVPAGMTMREAVLAGYDEVQHANFWFLNFMDADTVAKTHTPVRFTAVAARARDLDLSSPEAKEFIALLKAKGTVVDPTLIVFETMFTGWKGELAAWIAPWADVLPASSTRSARSGGRASTPEERVKFTESFTRMKQMLKALHDAGVPIVPGTDGTALLYSRELELYVEAGIPAADVLYLATLGSARVAQKDKETGSIARGKRADLVLVDGDPLARISDIRRTRMVVKGGVIYDAEGLATAAGLTRAL